MWSAFIDWADTHHVVAVLNEQGQQVATKQVDHTVEGLAQLTSFGLGHRGITRAVGGTGLHHRNQPWTAYRRFAGGRLSRLPSQSQNGGPPSQTRLSPKPTSLMLICWRKPAASRFADLRRLRPDSALIQELKTLTREEVRLIASQTRQVEPAHRLSQNLLPGGVDLI
jgi:hypothetical protein